MLVKRLWCFRKAKETLNHEKTTMFGDSKLIKFCYCFGGYSVSSTAEQKSWCRALVNQFIERKLGCWCRNEFKNLGGKRKQKRKKKQKRGNRWGIKLREFLKSSTIYGIKSLILKVRISEDESPTFHKASQSKCLLHLIHLQNSEQRGWGPFTVDKVLYLKELGLNIWFPEFIDR